MCPISKPYVASTNIPVHIPPPLPVLIGTPPLQLDPIIDYTGALPIANQKWDGTQYVTINNKGDFLEISKSTDPKILAYKSALSKPHIINIVDKVANKVNILDMLDLYNFGMSNADWIQNFGNSCYFGVAMHFIFIMSDIREFIINNNKYTDPLITPKKLAAYDKIKNLLIKMKSKQQIKQSDFSDYSSVKKEFMGNTEPKEEDAEEFITKFFTDLNDLTRKLIMQKYDQIAYHGNNNNVLSIKPADRIIFDIGLDIVRAYNNVTIENALRLSYEKMELQEGVNAIPDENGNYVFGYRFYEMVDLPQYLMVRINMIDPASLIKYPHNMGINTTITLTTRGKTKIYFLIGIIVHSGSNIDHGHYTASIFGGHSVDKKEFYYWYYNDAYKEQVKMPINDKIIPSGIYKRSFGLGETAYMLLYCDITKLN